MMALLTLYGLNKWVVIPMDPTNAPAMFIQTMNNLFVDILDKGVVFLDNILIYSNTVEKNFEFQKVFIHLHKYVFYCKLKKCSFIQKTATFLGFDITS